MPCMRRITPISCKCRRHTQPQAPIRRLLYSSPRRLTRPTVLPLPTVLIHRRLFSSLRWLTRRHTHRSAVRHRHMHPTALIRHSRSLTAAHGLRLRLATEHKRRRLPLRKTADNLDTKQHQQYTKSGSPWPAFVIFLCFPSVIPPSCRAKRSIPHGNAPSCRAQGSIPFGKTPSCRAQRSIPF